MDAITAINKRTSVRRFQPRPVARPVVEQLLECAVRAPNHKLTEPWRFAVLTGPAGGRFGAGGEAERLELDALDFCRTLSGRAAGAGLLATGVPF